MRQSRHTVIINKCATHTAKQDPNAYDCNTIRKDPRTRPRHEHTYQKEYRPNRQQFWKYTIKIITIILITTSVLHTIKYST